jgi:2-polyprenyl-3-methyl-5-hydroxy-6-metoxy-1,4-benzoquinol methylase
MSETVDLLDSISDVYSDEEDFLYNYDSDIVITQYIKRTLSLLPPSPSVLDLGLGRGIVAPMLHGRASRYVVVEGSKAIIDKFAASHDDSYEIAHATFEDFNINCKFDVIVMGFILEHVDDPVFILKRFKEFMAPDGRCFIAVPNGECLHRRIGKAAGLLDDLMSIGEGDLRFGHKRTYSVNLLKQHAGDAGLLVKRIEGLFLKPITTQQMKTLNFPAEVLDGMCAVAVDYPELSCGIFAEVAL